MKVVINKCYGGFSLSPEAIQRIAELNGRPCHFFTQDIKAATRLRPYIPASIEQAKAAIIFWAFSIPNPNDVLHSEKDWHEMTMAERQAQNADYQEVELSNRDYERNDPKLIQAVEELGEAANGPHAKLSIVEIPDGVAFEIDEYDGMERVAEAHRTWG